MNIKLIQLDFNEIILKLDNHLIYGYKLDGSLFANTANPIVIDGNGLTIWRIA
jgi:hypothetical protein